MTDDELTRLEEQRSDMASTFQIASNFKNNDSSGDPQLRSPYGRWRFLKAIVQPRTQCSPFYELFSKLRPLPKVISPFLPLVCWTAFTL
jgi:hypothetical protein